MKHNLIIEALVQYHELIGEEIESVKGRLVATHTIINNQG
jgi:hypothetical protein